MNEMKEIIAKMTLEDKIRLCSGANFWETEHMEQYGIPSFFIIEDVFLSKTVFSVIFVFLSNFSIYIL